MCAVRLAAIHAPFPKLLGAKLNNPTPCLQLFAPKGSSDPLGQSVCKHLQHIQSTQSGQREQLATPINRACIRLMRSSIHAALCPCNKAITLVAATMVHAPLDRPS